MPSCTVSSKDRTLLPVSLPLSRAAHTKAPRVLPQQGHESRPAEDEWAGLEDAKERRKRQNRQNVRAHRLRKALATAIEARTCERNRDSEFASRAFLYSYTGHDNATSSLVQANHHAEQALAQPSGLFRYFCWLSSQTDSAHSEASAKMSRLMLPLSRDHLLPLIQFNVMRAAVTNMIILGMGDYNTDVCSLFWNPLPPFSPPAEVPDTLLPTALQLATPHQRWIDLLPHPRMRDNAIRAQGLFDFEDLEDDLMGYVCGDIVLPGEDNSVEAHDGGMVVWTDPWRPEGYEVTPKFLEKWGFLVEGCEQMLHATNRWRALRGEGPLCVD
ncbi:hypothetical protein F5Y18DRAFT_390596 [Xylariaceae sp. FL1019]|nr:hypothetical protein F5Y18DRAFT_390596 [Xylariaceae sp. FL1019]